MDNLIEIEYFYYAFKHNGNSASGIPTAVLDDPKPFDVHATINTSQITSIIDCGRRNSNDEIVRHRTIVLSSGEIFLTLTPYNEILDKIKGKPKK